MRPVGRLDLVPVLPGALSGSWGLGEAFLWGYTLLCWTDRAARLAWESGTAGLALAAPLSPPVGGPIGSLGPYGGLHEARFPPGEKGSPYP